MSIIDKEKFKRQRIYCLLTYLIILIILAILYYICIHQSIYIDTFNRFLWLFIWGWLGLIIRSIVFIKYPSSPLKEYLLNYPIFLLAICSIVYFISIWANLKGFDFYISLSAPCLFFGYYIYYVPNMLADIFKKV